MYSKVYSGLVFLANDPHVEVSTMASKIVEYIKLKAKDKVKLTLVKSIRMALEKWPFRHCRKPLVQPN